MIGVPIGTGPYAMESATEIAEVLRSGTTHADATPHARKTGSQPDCQRTTYIQRVMDPELSLPACPKRDNSAM